MKVIINYGLTIHLVVTANFKNVVFPQKLYSANFELIIFSCIQIINFR